MKKFLSLLLALVMVFSLAACGNVGTTESGAPNNSSTPSSPGSTDDPGEPYVGPNWAAIDNMDYDSASWELYEYALGEYYKYYSTAKAEADDLDVRMALMAIAEAKMLESGVFLPIYTSGGNYAMSRGVPRSTSTVLWGLDEYRLHTALVCNELITSEDNAALKALWSAAETAAEYYEQAKAYLNDHGYTLTDEYKTTTSWELETWDVIATSMSSDSSFIAGTYDNLMEYDAKNILQYGLAESYDYKEVPGTYTTTDDDGNVVEKDTTLAVYTFHIRKGVQWVDQQGRPIGEVTANDWVTSMKHLMDNLDELGYLMTLSDGCGIRNFDAYADGVITDFSQVGVKAIDDYTLEYTLTARFNPFITMLGYGCFAPLNESFYKSQGGTFSADGDAYTAGNYGTSPSTIAYCGPYLVTNFTPNVVYHYEQNPTYWNIDAVTMKSVNYSFNDGSDTLRSYNEAKDGTIMGAGFNASALAQARQDIDPVTGKNYFDAYSYVSAGAGTTYCGWFNLNRQSFSNYDDPTMGVSSISEEEQLRSRDAMINQHFRLALAMAIDRGAYNGVSVGEELKYNRLRNSYTPGDFQFLANAVTVSINGKSTSFPAGTAYGAIMQAQLDADGVAITVWNPETVSGDGFDGWYNPANAKAELELAIAELAQIGVEISANKPIYLDYPYGAYNESLTNQANAFKQSLEKSLDGKVILNLVGFDDSTALTHAYYRINKGSEGNYNISTGSGWGPDYGDAQTYLDTIQPYGYMTKNIGVW